MTRVLLAASILLPSLFLAGPASAQVPLSGDFVAARACPAPPSIRGSDDVTVEANKSYKLLGKNKADATHYLIEVPGAQPPRRWVAIDCGSISGAAANQGSAPAAAGAGAGQSTAEAEYVFAVSWEPAFCETKPGKTECAAETAGGFDATHFSLHGLWPQPIGNQFCKVSPDIKALAEHNQFSALPPVNLSAPVRASLDQAMPGTKSSLERHEWWRHGTCAQGASPDLYFTTAITLLGQLNGSKLRDLFVAHIGGEVTLDQIRDALNASFGAGAGDRIQVQCVGKGGDRTITQIEINIAGNVIGDQPSLSQLIAAGPPMKQTSCPSGLVQQVGGQ